MGLCLIFEGIIRQNFGQSRSTMEECLLQRMPPPYTLKRAIKPYWFHQIGDSNPNKNAELMEHLGNIHCFPYLPNTAYRYIMQTNPHLD